MRTLLLLACALAAPAALAQNQIVSETKFFSDWPEQGPAAPTFLRAASGFFGLDGNRDTVVLRQKGLGTEALYQPNTHRLNSAYPIAPCRDLAVLPNAAPGGQHDGLLLVSDRGLELFWTVAGQTPTVVATHSTGGWTGVQRVWVVKSQFNTSWILGLDSAGTGLLRMTWSGSAFVPQTSIAAPLGLSHLESADYDGAGERELVMWSDPYCVIATWSATAIEVVSTVFSPSDLTPPIPYRRGVTVSRGISSPNAIERDLVVLHFYWSLTGQYYVVGFNSGVAPYLVPLGQIAANHLSSADLDGDGHQDVLLSRSDRSEVVMLRRTNQTNPDIPFALESQHLAALVVPPGVTDTGLDFTVPADFDGDGDIDLCSFQGEANRVHSFYSSVVSGRRPAGAKAPDLAVLPVGSLTWEVERPLDWDVMVGTPLPGDLRIRIEGWIQPSSGSLLEPARVIDVTVAADFPAGAAQVINATYSVPEIEVQDYVLQLHTYLVRMDGFTVIQTYPSTMTFYTPNFDYADALGDQVAYESNGPGDHDGDGSVSGNKGNKPPGSPPTP